jgi:hypothetical protein
LPICCDTLYWDEPIEQENTMSLINMQPISGPAVWKGADFDGDDRWIHRLREAELAEIDVALTTLKAKGKAFSKFSKEDFPLPKLSKLLRDFSDELENGRGFKLLRGLPIERYTDEDIRSLYYGLGLHMGQPVGQNPRGELLGPVQNVGDVHNKNTRVYETNLFLPYHSDPSDVVGLLCIRKAKQGGLSSLVSVASIYNELLKRHPEFMDLYARSWYFAHLCEPEPSLSPIFSQHQGKLSCRYLRQYTELGHEIRGVPLSKIELEALDAFDAVMHEPSMRITMMLEPGDIQFANNYAVLHSRTEFEDFEAPSQRRFMWRLWLKMPNARALAPEFPGRNGFPVPV